jgi:hypothetical protein
MKFIFDLKTILLPVLLSFTFVQCGGIRLIGAYDDKIDNGIQAVSKDVTAIFVQIDKNIDDSSDWSFKHFKSQYVELETELGALTTRAKALPKYSIVLKQLTILTNSIQTLEKDHASGFAVTNATTAQLKAAIAPDKKAIDESICIMLTLQEGLKRTSIDKPKTK